MNKIRLKIVDGHERVEKLDYSRKFLKNIQNQITKTFETKKFKVEKVKNKKCYTTQINNKWVCYYLNFLFGLEFGRKSKPRINKKIEFDCSQENLILRGLFDSDGSADNYKLSFGSIYYGLIKEVERILRKNEIKHIKIREQIRSESNNFYILTIHSESVLTYGKMIGFSHPRKIKEFKKYLLSKPTKRKLKHSKENTLFEIGKYLRPIANRKIRPTKAFFELGEVKKNRIITIFNRRFNMNFYEVLRPNLHINNRKLTREFNDIFEYKLIKTAVPIDQITSMERKWTKIWD